MLKTIMFASHRDPRMIPVLQCLDLGGYDYEVYSGAWRGFNSKTVAAYRAAVDLPAKYTHIMLIDAFDVLCVGCPDEVMRKFESLGHPWVMMAEVNCWPERCLAPMFPQIETPWRYPNTGAWVAERSHLLSVLTKWGGDSIDPSLYDQKWVIEKYLEDPAVFAMDTGCVLLQSLLGSFQHFDISRRALHNRLTNTDPLILHHHGGADVREDRLKPLWSIA